ncbi:RagB/SusD family nutrient uptake outer membrane protein [Parabacteroides sp. OttesenSCG-928-J18]|nr:RagB/SusD family nutrient uptake outer membrane protein [Parabacteroides sp. OttesenSCG-928-J18]
MKKIINSIRLTGLVALIALMVTSCSDFLNVSPSTSVADTDVFNTIAGAQAALNGSYYHMRAFGSGGVNSYDDWGVPSIQMISDACGEDIIMRGGWYIYNYNYWGETRGDIFRSGQLWRFHYQLINNVNSILAYTDDCSGSEIEKQHIKGQAHAIRGWAYFNLARLFQQTYIIAKNMPGVPIYLEPTTDQTEGKPRGTLEETYKQIVADLTAAETMLEGFDRGNRINNFDQSVTQGVLAQVYQVMHNWPKCEEYAKKLLSKYPLTSNEQYLGGFSDETVPSWIWGMRQSEEQNMGDYSPYAMWANGTRKCFSFVGWYSADKFVELFDQDDIRYQFERWWDVLWASYKFRDNDECRGSIVFMRTEEMLLAAAEACAYQGKEKEAKELLWKLQEMRNATRTEASGNDLLEAIWLERRKEMYGEGHALFDLVRTQKPLVRAGNHDAYGGSHQFPARSWRFIFQIPNTELLNNDALVDDIWPAGDQNPYSGEYKP